MTFKVFEMETDLHRVFSQGNTSNTCLFGTGHPYQHYPLGLCETRGLFGATYVVCLSLFHPALAAQGGLQGHAWPSCDFVGSTQSPPASPRFKQLLLEEPPPHHPTVKTPRGCVSFPRWLLVGSLCCGRKRVQGENGANGDYWDREEHGAIGRHNFAPVLSRAA